MVLNVMVGGNRRWWYPVLKNSCKVHGSDGDNGGALKQTMVKVKGREGDGINRQKTVHGVQRRRSNWSVERSVEHIRPSIIGTQIIN